MSLYSELKEAGIQVDNHESDLYVKVSPESTTIIKKYKFRMITTFKSQIDNTLWYDIPFAYTPWWEKRGCFCS